jgi:hypothetical protein
MYDAVPLISKLPIITTSPLLRIPSLAGSITNFGCISPAVLLGFFIYNLVVIDDVPV